MISLVLSILICLAWWALVFSIWRHRKYQIKLSSESSPSTSLPTLSVIIPMRNEADTLHLSIESLKKCEYPNFEIIAVDDRSTDSTWEKLQAAQKEDSRIRCIQIKKLPPEFLGKPHALKIGLENANGELILFTDADVIFEPQALKTSCSLMVEKHLDQLAVMPRFIYKGFWESVALTCFGFALMLGRQTWKINRPGSKAFLGIGAFNLLRRSTIERTNLLETIKFDVLEDVSTGQWLRQKNCRILFVNGMNLAAVRYQVGVMGMIRGLEKNAFAAMHYSWTRTIFRCSHLIVMTLWPFLGLTMEGWQWNVASLIAMPISFYFLTPFLPFWMSWTLPIGAWIIAVAIVRSAWITSRNRGIQWRDHFYEIKKLKEAQVYEKTRKAS